MATHLKNKKSVKICVNVVTPAKAGAVSKKSFDQKYQIMQNKPNFQNAKNVISSVITMTNNNEL